MIIFHQILSFTMIYSIKDLAICHHATLNYDALNQRAILKNILVSYNYLQNCDINIQTVFVQNRLTNASLDINVVFTSDNMLSSLFYHFKNLFKIYSSSISISIENSEQASISLLQYWNDADLVQLYFTNITFTQKNTILKKFVGLGIKSGSVKMAFCFINYNQDQQLNDFYGLFEQIQGQIQLLSSTFDFHQVEAVSNSLIVSEQINSDSKLLIQNCTFKGQFNGDKIVGFVYELQSGTELSITSSEFNIALSDDAKINFDVFGSNNMGVINLNQLTGNLTGTWNHIGVGIINQIDVTMNTIQLKLSLQLQCYISGNIKICSAFTTTNNLNNSVINMDAETIEQNSTIGVNQISISVFSNIMQFYNISITGGQVSIISDSNLYACTFQSIISQKTIFKNCKSTASLKSISSNSYISLIGNNVDFETSIIDFIITGQIYSGNIVSILFTNVNAKLNLQNIDITTTTSIQSTNENIGILFYDVNQQITINNLKNNAMIVFSNLYQATASFSYKSGPLFTIVATNYVTSTSNKTSGLIMCPCLIPYDCYDTNTLHTDCISNLNHMVSPTVNIADYNGFPAVYKLAFNNSANRMFLGFRVDTGQFNNTYINVNIIAGAFGGTAWSMSMNKPLLYNVKISGLFNPQSATSPPSIGASLIAVTKSKTVIVHCVVWMTIQAVQYADIGGLVGIVEAETIVKNCIYNGSLIGSTSSQTYIVGGVATIVRENNKLLIQDVLIDAKQLKATGGSKTAGGFVGYIQSGEVYIRNSNVTGIITKQGQAGIYAGYIEPVGIISIANCYHSVAGYDASWCPTAAISPKKPDFIC